MPKMINAMDAMEKGARRSDKKETQKYHGLICLSQASASAYMGECVW